MIKIIGHESFRDDNISKLQRTDPKTHKCRKDLDALESMGLISFNTRSDETVFDHLFDRSDTEFSKLVHKTPKKD